MWAAAYGSGSPLSRGRSGEGQREAGHDTGAGAASGQRWQTAGQRLGTRWGLAAVKVESPWDETKKIRVLGRGREHEEEESGVLCGEPGRAKREEKTCGVEMGKWSVAQVGRVV